MLRRYLQISHAVTVRYVLGNVRLCRMPDAVPKLRRCAGNHAFSCSAIEREQQLHSDLVALPLAQDCSSRAVAQKTFHWYRYASASTSALWLGKMDDDSFPNLEKLARDVLTMDMIGQEIDSAERKSAQFFAYYGVMRWRLWSSRSLSACGPFNLGFTRCAGVEVPLAPPRSTCPPILVTACFESLCGEMSADGVEHRLRRVS